MKKSRDYLIDHRRVGFRLRGRDLCAESKNEMHYLQKGQHPAW